MPTLSAVKDCIQCGKPVPKGRYSLCSRTCRDAQRRNPKPVTLECEVCKKPYSFLMTAANYRRKYCDDCVKVSKRRSYAANRQMMGVRKYRNSDSEYPLAWIPTAKEYPDWIGQPSEPMPIEGSAYQDQIQKFLDRGGQVQHLPAMPADVTGHDDHQILLRGSDE